MKNLMIIILLCMLVFMYMNRGADVDYVAELKAFPAEVQSFVANMKDVEKRNIFRVELQKMLNALSKKYNVPKINVAGDLVVADEDDVYLSITLNTGFVAEGKLLKKTTSGDYILALPGSKITVAHDRIKEVRPLDDSEKEVLQAMLHEAAEKTSAKKSKARSVAQLNAPIQWEKNYAVALKKAQAQGRPVLLDFYTDWCGWCKKLDKEVFQNPEVRRKLREHFICVKVNGDKQKDLVSRYHVQGFPNIVFLNSEGDVVYQQPGYVPLSTFVQIVDSVVEKT